MLENYKKSVFPTESSLQTAGEPTWYNRERWVEFIQICIAKNKNDQATVSEVNRDVYNFYTMYGEFMSQYVDYSDIVKLPEIGSQRIDLRSSAVSTVASVFLVLAILFV